MTPEGTVKHAVQKLLSTYRDSEDLWYFMPVPGGFGAVGTPDFIGHCRGWFFAIETKAPGKKPTRIQEMIHNAIRMAGTNYVFVIDEEGCPDWHVLVAMLRGITGK